MLRAGIAGESMEIRPFPLALRRLEPFYTACIKCTPGRDVVEEQNGAQSLI